MLNESQKLELQKLKNIESTGHAMWFQLDRLKELEIMENEPESETFEEFIERKRKAHLTGKITVTELIQAGYDFAKREESK
jgi:hypothetical protein